MVRLWAMCNTIAYTSVCHSGDGVCRPVVEAGLYTLMVCSEAVIFERCEVLIKYGFFGLRVGVGRKRCPIEI
jgi:hypothetical protein